MSAYRAPPRGPRQVSGGRLMTKRAMELGTAGEHLVCADLLCRGHRAFMSAAGLPYDVIADVDGRLVRVAVKATSAPRERPGRGGSKYRYGFNIFRAARHSNGAHTRQLYTRAECDLVALVALDIKRIAYLKVETAPQTMWIEAPTEQPAWRSGKALKTIKDFDDFNLEDALKW